MRYTLLGLAAASLLAWGCGPGGPNTYPVEGRVELNGGEVKHLAGCTIEAALEDNPAVRASGAIREDGTFALETLHQGTILRGAQAGKYQVRLILGDDDRAARRRAAQSLNPRYLDFKKSGLSLQVPADGEVPLRMSAR